jgi:hypothetical protein
MALWLLAEAMRRPARDIADEPAVEVSVDADV